MAFKLCENYNLVQNRIYRRAHHLSGPAFSGTRSTVYDIYIVYQMTALKVQHISKVSGEKVHYLSSGSQKLKAAHPVNFVYRFLGKHIKNCQLSKFLLTPWCVMTYCVSGVCCKYIL